MRPAFKGLTSLLAGSGAQFAANAIAAMLATLWLPVEQRGLMVTGLAVASLIGLFAAFGLGNVYRSRHPRTPMGDLPDLVKTYTVASALAVVVGVGAGWCSSWLFSLIADPALASWPLLIAISISTGVQVLQLLVTEARFALGHFAPGTSWATTASLVGLVGIVIAHMTDREAAGFMMWQASLTAAVLLCAAWSAFKADAFCWGRSSLKTLATFTIDGAQSLGLSIAIVVVSRADRLVLASFASTGVVAVYALAATIAELLRLAPTAVGQLITRRVAEGADWKTVVQAQKWTFLASTLIAVSLLAAGFWVLPRVFGPAYASASIFLGILLCGELFYSVLVVSSRALIGGEWSRFATSLGIGVVLAGMPMYVVLAWFGGAIGGSIARVAVFALAAAVATLGLYRRLNSRSPGRSRSEELASTEGGHDI